PRPRQHLPARAHDPAQGARRRGRRGRGRRGAPRPVRPRRRLTDAGRRPPCVVACPRVWSPRMTWRIATRRSGLAQAQARTVGEALATVTDRPYELVPLATTGDEHPERAIEAFDSKGLF